MSRETVYQQAPDDTADYTEFPSKTVPKDARWFRQHRNDKGPWWFSSTGGRFDLPSPQGTCYLANQQDGALLELIGPSLASTRRVDVSVLEGRVISELTIPIEVRGADISTRSAGTKFGVTSELPTMIPYSVPQAWARCLAKSGFGAIMHRLRFSPHNALGLALFGVGGEPKDWPPPERSVSAVTLAEEVGVQIVRPPDDDQITVVKPQ